MSSTAFVNGSTLTDAGWFNDTDTQTYCRLTSVSGTNTIVGTGPVSMTAYAAGQFFILVPAATTTGAATLNITPSGGSALGAKNIFWNGAALIRGEITINVPAMLYYDGTQFHLLARAFDATYRGRTTADTTYTTNTTLADITGLSFPIAANEEWRADFYVSCGSEISTTGVKLAVTVPSGATLQADAGISPNGVDVNTVFLRNTTTGGAALEYTTSQVAAASRGLVHVSIWVLNGVTPGTVQLQGAQSTSSGTALTLAKGANFLANKII